MSEEHSRRRWPWPHVNFNVTIFSFFVSQTQKYVFGKRIYISKSNTVRDAQRAVSQCVNCYFLAFSGITFVYIVKILKNTLNIL